MTRAPLLAEAFAALDASWPPAAAHRVGSETAQWIVREGGGAGSRVSAISPEGHDRAEGIEAAEACARDLGQAPIFRIRPGQETIDAALAARGYRIADPSVVLAAAVPGLAAGAVPMSGFAIWPPLAVMEDIWSECGIGAARRAVMARAPGARAAVMARVRDRPAGVAFVAVPEGGIGVVHALAVRAGLRRLGAAQAIMRHAAAFARERGAGHLALVVTEANAPALALYAGLGFERIGHYHYRTR